MYESEIYQNYALSSPVAQLKEGVVLSIIDNSEIHNNIALTESEIAEELFEECELLCFVPSTFKTYLIEQRTKLLDFKLSRGLVQLISAPMEIRNSSIYNQETLFSAFISSLSLVDTHIYNITVVET